MGFPMTYTAKGYEIFVDIASQMASRLDVMDLEIFGTSASLTLPTVALENPLTKSPIGIPVQAKSGLSWDGAIHEALGIRSKNASRWEFGSSR